MKVIPWLLIIILCVCAASVFISDHNKIDASNNAYKILQDRFSDTIKDYADFRSWSDSALNNATATAIQNGEIAAASKAQLDQSRIENNVLIARLNNELPAIIIDSAWISKHPAFVWGCDSLIKRAGAQDSLINIYERDNQAHVDALAYETQIRDSALQRERLYSKVFQQQLIGCMNSLDKSEKQKKKAQLYAGMAAWGNALTPLGGGEINLGLKTRSDQFFEIKGAYIRQWWIGAGVKFVIHSPF